MNSFERDMKNLLKDLKESCGVIGVKAEFESEGASLEEALYLKNITSDSDLDFTLKIGGCAAIKDMYDAKIIGADSLVAPMIESKYAAEKYVQGIKSVFSEEEINSKKFYINIETKTGFETLDDILNSKSSEAISGIVMGRTDFAGSLGMDKEQVESEIIFEHANSMAEKIVSCGKEFIVGGGVTPSSLNFLKRLPKNSLSKIETRKIIFDYNKLINSSNPEGSIIKALKFEIMWLKNKKDSGKFYTEEDQQRLKLLEERCLQFSTMKVL